MRKFFPTIFLLMAMPAAVQAAEPFRINRDGYDLEYSVARLPNGSRQITGMNLKTGEKFDLVVSGRWVTGKFGSTRVSFRAPRQKATPAAATTELASK